MEGTNKENKTEETQAETTPVSNVVTNSSVSGDISSTDTVVKSPAGVIETTVDTKSDTSVADLTGEVVLAQTATGAPRTALRQYFIAGALLVIMGGVVWYGLEQQGRIHTGIFAKIQSIVVPEKAAAVVNGTKITMADYEKNRQQIIASAQQQGLDTTDPKAVADINSQAIDVLVNTELLRQAATEAGVTVTSDQIEARYEEVVKSVGGADELTKRMTTLGITDESLRKDIKGEILIQSYLSTAVDTSTVTVDSSEVQATYNHAVASSTDASTIPPLQNVQSQIEAQLKIAKQQDMINAYIKTLKDKADIQILI